MIPNGDIVAEHHLVAAGNAAPVSNVHIVADDKVRVVLFPFVIDDAEKQCAPGNIAVVANAEAIHVHQSCERAHKGILSQLLQAAKDQAPVPPLELDLKRRPGKQMMLRSRRAHGARRSQSFWRTHSKPACKRFRLRNWGWRLKRAQGLRCVDRLAPRSGRSNRE